MCVPPPTPCYVPLVLHFLSTAVISQGSSAYFFPTDVWWTAIYSSERDEESRLQQARCPSLLLVLLFPSRLPFKPCISSHILSCFVCCDQRGWRYGTLNYGQPFWEAKDNMCTYEGQKAWISLNLNEYNNDARMFRHYRGCSVIPINFHRLI